MFARFANKASLCCKQGFFALQTRLISDANKASLQTGGVGRGRKGFVCADYCADNVGRQCLVTRIYCPFYRFECYYVRFF